MREGQKAYIRELYRQIKNAEEAMRGKQMPELTKEDFFLFHETGNRLVYENAYFGRRKYLTVYAILALWSRELARQGILECNMDEKTQKAAEEGYIRRLEEILANICQEQFWALPAHVDFERIDEPGTRLTIDLFAAETAQALSEIVLRLYGRLSYKIVACVGREVVERVLQPFVLSEFPYSWWETDRCNWSAVCAGAIGMAAMNLEALNRKVMSDNMPENSPVCLDVLLFRDCMGRLPVNWKENCLKRVCDALECYLEGMESDGACTEGLGYYNYGMSFYAAFAEAYGAENSQIQAAGQLMYRDKCEQIAMFQQKCYFTGRVGKGVSISFSDGSQHESFLPGLTAYLKHCYPQVQTPDDTLARPFDEDACYRYLTNERNISWLVKYAGKDADPECGGKQDKESIAHDTLTSYLLPAAQWLICQDANGNGFAAKGGNNDENHNHNDIGHFLCVFDGEMLLADLGAGEYTKDYFGDRRYDILCNRSFGHSVPIINGMEQCAGKEYCADSFIWNADEHMLTMELAGAYSKGSIHSLVRQIRMVSPENLQNRQQGRENYITEPVKMQIEIEDLFTAGEGTHSIAENLITEYEVVTQQGALLIQSRENNCCCQIFIEINGRTAAENLVDVIPCEHKDHHGASKTVYRLVWNVAIDECRKSSCKMWITFYEKRVEKVVKS